MRYLISLPLAAALAALAPSQVSYFTASADGGQEVPPNNSTASGWSIVRLQRPANTVRIFAFVTGLNPAAAHLHQAPAGSNGPVLVPLSNAGGGVWTGMGTLTPAQATSLENGGMYVNFHTAAFPGGEIRGQVVDAKTNHFVAGLDGSQEVPPNNSNATGTGFAALHQPDNRLVYVVQTTGLTNVVAAHIHRAPAGTNGPVIHPLIGSHAQGMYCGVTDKLDSTDLTALRADGLYFNVHTSTFPGGEIRGQIIDGSYDFVAALDGSQEVPPNNSNAIANGCVTINPDNTATYRVLVQNLTNTFVAAHFHNAPPGTNGPVVFPLSGSPPVFSGTTPPLTATQLADLRAGNWYFNVHTNVFPGGEIRGQILEADLHSTFGGGCPGSNGIVPEIATRGVACQGSSFELRAFGATPNRLALATIGSRRDIANGVPLPVALNTVGFNAPGCFVLVAPGPIATVFTDSIGCATLPVRLGLIPSLAGAEFYAQWFVFDPGANPAGLVTTNALELEVQ